MRHYTFMVNLDRCNGRCNSFDDPSDRIYLANKTENVNINVFTKTLTKHISCECKRKFDGRKLNLYQKWNKELCWCECKNLRKHRVCEKYYIWNPSTCMWKWKIFRKHYRWFSNYVQWNYRGDKSYFSKSCLNKNYFKKNYLNKFERKNGNLQNGKFLYFTDFFINYHITFDNRWYYCFPVKHWSKQKYLLPYRDVSNNIKGIDIDNKI